ncbi:hypothetical protein M115_1764 [Bacteroides fragilis str. 3719 T6]|nr:hypothetical protein M115_1764 [Bacteroides fragilis str. 3719 T6]EYA75656.1 hypothetical protein M133_1719 [Bacteroides fragilis str. S24L26]
MLPPWFCLSSAEYKVCHLPNIRYDAKMPIYIYISQSTKR